MKHLYLVLLAGCAAPSLEGMFNKMDLQILDQQGSSDSFVERIRSADSELLIALPYGQDEAITNALIDKWNEGVLVEVTTDMDQAEDPGIVALQEANIRVTLNDGPVDYFDFSLLEELFFAGKQTQMTHSYVITDQQSVLWASEVGTLEEGPRVVLDIVGEELIEDWSIEHNQVYAGTDATAFTAFGAMAKSIADGRWTYGFGDDTQVEFWLGPQERLMKRVTDAVYGARSNVRVVTDDFTNAGLAGALQAKAGWGFPVEVVVGPNWTVDAIGIADRLRKEMLTLNAPEVPVRQHTNEFMPTLLIIDDQPDANGVQWQSRVFVISHDMVSASRLFTHRQVNGGYETIRNDQLMDGGMWVFNSSREPTERMQGMIELAKDLFDEGEEL